MCGQTIRIAFAVKGTKENNNAIMFFIKDEHWIVPGHVQS